MRLVFTSPRSDKITMTSRQILVSSLLTVLGVFALAGCNVIPPVQPDITRNYLLTAPISVESGTQTGTGTLRLGLRPVEVAPYLRKGSLVVRTGDNEVAFPNEARWAEPLGQEIASLLRRRLQASPTVARVLVPPFPFEPARDFDLSVQVVHCEGVRQGERSMARVVAVLEVFTAGGNPQIVLRKTIAAPETAWDGKDYARLAALLGEAVGVLGQEIVASLPEKKT